LSPRRCDDVLGVVVVMVVVVVVVVMAAVAPIPIVARQRRRVAATTAGVGTIVYTVRGGWEKGWARKLGEKRVCEGCEANDSTRDLFD
jgi:hypothetical protein